MSFHGTHDGPMLQGSSPGRLRELLEEYEAILVALGGPLVEGMAPGIDAVEVEVKLASRGLSCPDEVAVWFGWHNGVRIIDGLSQDVFPLFLPHSLDEALGIYDYTRVELERAYEEGLDYDLATNGAGEGWIQLDPMSQSIAVECVNAGSVPPRVRWANFEFADSMYGGKFRAVSLCTPVANWIEAARNGAFTWLEAEQVWRIYGERLITIRTDSILG